MVGRPNSRTSTLLVAGLAVLFLAGLVPVQAAEVSRAPFQLSVLSTCSTTVCRFVFPKVAAKRRMDIQFVSCALATPAADPASVGPAALGVNNAFAFPQLLLGWEARSNGSSVSLTVSRTVVFSISANNRAQIGFEYEGDLSAILSCSISGELVTLQ